MKIIFLDDDYNCHPKHLHIAKFSLGERKVSYSDIYPGDDVLLVQDLKHNEFVGQKIFDLLLSIKSLPADCNISVLLPYLYYSRQDKDDETALWIFLNLLSSYRVKEITTFDIHNLNIIEKSPVKITNISMIDFLSDDILNSLYGIIVSPDVGGGFRANYLAKKLDLEYIQLYKDKNRNISINSSDKEKLQRYKSAIVIDDIFDSGKTIFNAISSLEGYGIEEVDVIVTHYYGGGDIIFPKIVSRVISNNFSSLPTKSLFIKVNMVENYLNKIKSLTK